MPETPYRKVNIVDASGNLVTFGGGGTGGDASATNQQTEILRLEAIRDRLPNALVNGRLPVDVQSLSVTIGNAQLEIGNDAGNPIPVNGTVSISNLNSDPATGTNQNTANVSLAAINGKLPSNPASQSDIQAVRDRLPSALVGDRFKVDVPSLPSGSNFIGRTGVIGFRTSTNFTRAADTTQYASLDAITNSTSAPTILSADLSGFGATNNSFICFTNARIISSVAAAVLPNANVVIFNQTFSATNDNSQLNIDDTTAQTGGIIIPCLNTYNLGANSRCVSDSGQWIMQLGASSTSIFFTLQAVNAYTPASAERFDIVLDGYLL